LRGARDSGIQWIVERLPQSRFASQAGPKACCFCILAGGKKTNIRPRGPTAGAAWLAIDARRLDGIDKLTVGSPVSREHLPPYLIGFIAYGHVQTTRYR
jgi:hypothetical protein